MSGLARQDPLTKDGQLVLEHLHFSAGSLFTLHDGQGLQRHVHRAADAADHDVGHDASSQEHRKP